MKAPAPRREPAPLGDVEGSTHAAPAARPATEDVAVPEAPAGTAAPAAEATPAEAAAAATGTTEPATAEPSGSIDLNAVLARRRAAGE
jgi:hypothetical protein